MLYLKTFEKHFTLLITILYPQRRSKLEYYHTTIKWLKGYLTDCCSPY